MKNEAMISKLNSSKLKFEKNISMAHNYNNVYSMNEIRTYVIFLQWRKLHGII